MQHQNAKVRQWTNDSYEVENVQLVSGRPNMERNWFSLSSYFNRKAERKKIKSFIGLHIKNNSPRKSENVMNQASSIRWSEHLLQVHK